MFGATTFVENIVQELRYAKTGLHLTCDVCKAGQGGSFKLKLQKEDTRSRDAVSKHAGTWDLAEGCNKALGKGYPGISRKSRS